MIRRIWRICREMSSSRARIAHRRADKKIPEVIHAGSFLDREPKKKPTVQVPLFYLARCSDAILLVLGSATTATST